LRTLGVCFHAWERGIRMQDRVWFRRLVGGAVFFAVAVSGAVANIEVIYSKAAGHPTANIPGTLDVNGDPAASDWRAIEDFAVGPNGRQWMVKGRTQLGSDAETILVLGAGGDGQAASNFAQEGQPFIGAEPDELYDFFDSGDPVSFDTLGNFVFSARARGGATTDNEKVIFVDPNGVQTLVLQQGDAALGLTDNPPGNSGDEVFGNSIGSVTILEMEEQLQFVNTPITNLHSSRYPAMFRGNMAFRQSGISMIDGETWDSFDLSDSGGTPDGLHWYAEGDTENPDTNVDDILAVDDVAVMRQGSEVAGPNTPVYADVFQTRMVANGFWVSRGDDPANDDWVVGRLAAPVDTTPDLIVKTGDEIVPDSEENWGAVFSAVACNRQGDWALVGNTSSVDLATDNVLVLNGAHIIAREGDPVDLDGNGLFDDDAFIGRGNNTLAPFAANDLYVTDRRVIYFTANLRNSEGEDLNSSPAFGTPDAFMRVQFCLGDIERDLDVDLTDLSLQLAAFGTCDGDVGYNLLADLDDSGCVDLVDLSLMLAEFGTICD